MQGSDILTVIAEISVALAGFSGIVVALRHRALESWPAHEFSRFRNMLELAAYSIFFALFPFLPYHLGASSEVIWSLSSFALAAGLSGWLALTLYRTRGLVRKSFPAAWFWLYTFGTVASSLLALVNALGLVGTPQLGVYLVCLGWMLFFAISLFVRLALGPGSGAKVE
jgi:hypothetical protein